MAIIDIRVQLGTTPIWGTPFTDGHLMRMMERYGITQSVVSSTMANSCDPVRGNAEIKQVIGKKGILGCAALNTQYPLQAIEDLRRYMPLSGFAAILIRSGSPGRAVTLDESSEILNAHRRYSKPVMIEAAGRDAVIEADEIAKAFPGIKFVLLSMGGTAWRTAIASADKTLNLVLEVSGSLGSDKISLAVETVGAHRMVYGSNVPFVDPAVTIGLVEDARISDADKKLIFEGSAKRLFASQQAAE